MREITGRSGGYNIIIIMIFINLLEPEFYI